MLIYSIEIKKAVIIKVGDDEKVKLENNTDILDKIFEQKQEELGVIPYEIKEKKHYKIWQKKYLRL